jgi:hypothetical protein
VDPLIKGTLSRGADMARVEAGQPIVLLLYEAVSGGPGAGIHPQHKH